MKKLPMTFGQCPNPDGFRRLCPQTLRLLFLLNSRVIFEHCADLSTSSKLQLMI